MREAHLRDFLAVIETGSVRSAARKLGITQAAVSKNLGALERSLGVPLLMRMKHGVEPTDYGRVALRRARIVEAELKHLQEELESLAGERQGQVSVGLSATAEALLLPAAIARFHERHPDTVVGLTGGRSASTIGALREGRIDFVVGPIPHGDVGTDVSVERLCSSELGVVARAGHPHGRSKDLADLHAQSWAFAVRRSDGTAVLQQVFADKGLPPPRLAAHCDSGSALLSVLLQSDMVSLASVAAMQPYIERRLLTVLPIELGLPPVVQHLVLPSTRPLTTIAAELASEFRRVSRRLRR